MVGYENYPAPAAPEPTPTPTPGPPVAVPEFNALGLVALIHFFFLEKRKPVLKEKVKGTPTWLEPEGVKRGKVEGMVEETDELRNAGFGDDGVYGQTWDKKEIKSAVENTFTFDCFLNAFSLDQIGKLNLNANAKYSILFHRFSSLVSTIILVSRDIFMGLYLTF